MPRGDTPPLSLTGRRVFVAGHRGMVGSALVRRLAREECALLTAERSELDLRDQRTVNEFFAARRPEIVFVAAATVGGILANDARPADFIYDNIAIAANVIDAAWRAGVRKLLFLASSCVYPKHAPQPVREEALLSGPLEPTNEWYAIAKIAGIKLCAALRRQHGCDFITAMPTNLYGPGDNFDLASSHVLPALISKLHRAKLAGAPTVEIWGTGRPRREFLHVDDLADACIFLVKHYSDEPHINVGCGEDIAIADIARRLAAIVGFEGEFVFATDKPDGTPRKLLDTSRLSAMGWRPTIGLDDGLRRAYAWFLEHEAGRTPLPQGR